MSGEGPAARERQGNPWRFVVNDLARSPVVAVVREIQYLAVLSVSSQLVSD
jgi:hypothetical protein